MQTIPRAEWGRRFAELSGDLQGRAATFEVAGPEPELIAHHVPFDGLRLAAEGEHVCLVASGGGQALATVEAPATVWVAAPDEAGGCQVLVETDGGPALRLAFAPARAARRPRPEQPLRERSVGGA